MKTKLVFGIVTWIAMILSSASFTFAQSECDLSKAQKDFDASSFMSTWTKNTSPYNVFPSSTLAKIINLEIIYDGKKDTLTYNFETEAKMVKAEDKILEVVIVNKETKVIRTYHYWQGVDLRTILPYKETDCLRLKFNEKEILLANPAGDYIIRYNPESKSYFIAKTT